MGNEVKFYERIDELDSYFEELKKYRPLSKKDEKELSRKIKSGDENAFNKLVTSNLRFVVKIAKQYRRYSSNFADLISEGNLGLMKAARNFDETKDIKFISYAVWWIRAFIQEYIDNNNKMNTVTVDDYVFNKQDDEYEVTSTLINSEFEDEMIDAQSRNSSLNELMSCLEKRERLILSLYFGLYGKKESTLDEIGQEMSLTKERVRQIKDKAIVKIKSKALMSDEFDTFCSLR